MVTVKTKLGGFNTPMNGFGLGIGEFFNPTPTELWDGMDAGQFPQVGTVKVSQIQLVWEFGTTTAQGRYSVTDQSLDPQPVSRVLNVDGPNGAIRVLDMRVPLSDTLAEGVAIAASLPGISNEEGFYRSLFKGADVFQAGRGDDFLVTYNGADDVRSGRGNDTILTGKGEDRAIGFTGNDFIDLGTGDDWGKGGQGNDRIFGRAGDDEIIGESGRDKLFGGGGNDSISGGPGADRMKGGAGSDRLRGFTGDDTMEGGAGADFFDFFVSVINSKDLGIDTILDFEFGADKLRFLNTDGQFSDLGFAAYAGGTEITLSTAKILATIRVEGTAPTDFAQSDFVFSMV